MGYEYIILSLWRNNFTIGFCYFCQLVSIACIVLLQSSSADGIALAVVAVCCQSITVYISKLLDIKLGLSIPTFKFAVYKL